MVAMIFLLFGCGSPDGAADTAVGSGADCPDIVASFECQQGPTGDADAMWTDQPGYAGPIGQSGSPSWDP